jgi:hypothetical protein
MDFTKGGGGLLLDSRNLAGRALTATRSRLLEASILRRGLEAPSYLISYSVTRTQKLIAITATPKQHFSHWGFT